MAGKIETILTNLKTTFDGVRIGGVAAFVEVDNRLRPTDKVQRVPALDFLIDQDSPDGFIDGTAQRRAVVIVHIAQKAQPGTNEGAALGDLIEAVDAALLAGRCLSGACKTMQIGVWDFIYDQVGSGGSPIGAVMELTLSYSR